VAKTVSFAELASFDPTVSALAFDAKKAQNVVALDHLDFFFAGSAYALEKERAREVPLPVAMLLLCKRKALLL
jgi:hypothetical protein